MAWWCAHAGDWGSGDRLFAMGFFGRARTSSPTPRASTPTARPSISASAGAPTSDLRQTEPRRSTGPKSAKKAHALAQMDAKTREQELEAKRKDEEERQKLEDAQAEYRYGQRINSRPAVPLTTPARPPPPTAKERWIRVATDGRATAAILDHLPKYISILRDVSLFSDMGDEELEEAAKALEVKHFKAGEIIYDEGDEGRDCWVLEKGTVVSSQLIPGIVGSGMEWKETRPYKPGKFGSYFGERGLRRGEPRPCRMICRTDVMGLRITQENYIAVMRIREYKENLLRGACMRSRAYCCADVVLH